ncbi:DUF308 domain-containing protein [Eubacterium aggregans]|uniref:DUF308 domain-containing protein n=1 Tax=Eubacterium aggregans TaxID=81409 RepID=UPI003F2B3902
MEKSWQQKAMGLAAGLVVIAVGILLVIKPRQSMDTLAVIISVGILVMAVINGVGTFINRHKSNTGQVLETVVELAAAAILFYFRWDLGGLLPRKLLKDYDDKIASEDANAFLQSQNIIVAEKKTLNPFNVEILIHLSKKFMESFGHVDLILGDEAISYGNFDGHSYRLEGAISDGVLFRCNRERYLYQSTHHDEKVLYAFKVAFSDEELKQIARNFERMKENMVPWYCDTQLAEQGILPEGDYDDVADVICKGNQAAFYKFTKGTLRTYFAVDTNCVKVADSIFEGTGFDKPAIPGIVTPGAYYEFLMHELEAPGTKVYERVLYAKETITEEPVI